MNHATPTEEEKVLIPESRLPRFAESLVHLALLAISPYVLSLNFRYTYWSDTGAPNVNTKLDVFQFAAKPYEILLCASELVEARRAELEMIKGKNDVRAGGKSGDRRTSVYNQHSVGLAGGELATGPLSRRA
jgi:hypothetical protein